jgi:hypothetical protein
VDRQSVWMRLGIGALKIADTQISSGALTVLFETSHSLWKERHRDRVEGLDWELEYHLAYPVEMPNLLKVDDSALAPVLPQVPLFLPEPGFDPKSVQLVLAEADFRAEFVVQEVVDSYEAVALARGKLFFNGENARLLQADAERFVFQGSFYFDYLGTNLALDIEHRPFGSRRRQISPEGALESLAESVLANATGINGLMFTSDGRMVLQRRGDNVIIRPSQICPGFSGTIDKDDIENALGRGGSLADLRAAREMVEETGVSYSEVKMVKFLGVTRELIRGGAPEMFYALDLNVSHASIMNRHRKDNEGELLFVDLGVYGRAAGLPKSSGMTLNQVLVHLADAVQGKHSLPLITNLVLWHRARTG